MLPLFYATDHINYALDGLYYLKSMKGLPKNIRNYFMKGEHTVQHRAGIFLGICSDMAIETSYMRCGHSSSSRLVGLEMKPETMKTWAYSLNSCCEIVEGLHTMQNKLPRETELNKEEMKNCIRKDQIDRQVLQTKIENPITIFRTNQHPKDALVNITTGKIITDPTVNVEESLRIGEQKLQEFEAKKSGFYDPIKQTVKTLNVSRKRCQSRQEENFGSRGCVCTSPCIEVH